VTDACSGCGRAVAGGTAGCRAQFEALVGRDFSDPRFFATHRLFVDVYALQHPDEYCRSAKSLAAHLGGLCLILEREASMATGGGALRDWLDGPRALDKPTIPASRGATTLADLLAIDDPAAWREAVRRWAETVWDAWRGLHPIARHWVTEALASGRRRPSR
jgi:hypothetical protein